MAAVLFGWMITGWSTLMTGFADFSTHGADAHGWLGWPAAFVIAVPVISGLLYGPIIQRWAPTARGHGIPEVMLAVRRKGGRIPGRVAAVKLIASAMTIGGGGSAGREGPIVQVGASLGSAIARRLRMPTNRVVLLAACGSAAGIAATFNAPMAGAVFALEVILTTFTAESFGFMVVASVMASLVARVLQGDRPLVDLHASLEFPAVTDMGWVAVIGLLAGLAGVFFSKMLYVIEDAITWLWRFIPLPEGVRPGVLGLVLGIGLLSFPQLYGSGYPIQLEALQGNYTVGFLLLLALGRLIFTSWTIGMGGSGGVFAPTLFIGAMVGSAIGQVIAPLAGASSTVFGVIGMGAAFAGAARAPMTAVLIIIEMTGQYSLVIPMMLAVVIATGASRFLTASTIYTEKLHRRGDTLDDPAEHTLLGTRTAKALMSPVPALLTPDMTIKSALSQMRKSRVTSLPVADADGIFQGVVTTVDLAEFLDEEGSADTPIGNIDLYQAAVNAQAFPSTVLDQLRTPGVDGVAVVDSDHRVIGWISHTDLIERMYRDQCRAVQQRDPDSWGSRTLARWHNRSARP